MSVGWCTFGEEALIGGQRKRLELRKMGFLPPISELIAGLETLERERNESMEVKGPPDEEREEIQRLRDQDIDEFR